MGFGYILIAAPLAISLLFGMGGNNGVKDQQPVELVAGEAQGTDAIPGSEKPATAPDSDTKQQQTTSDGVVSTVERPAEPDRPSEPSVTDIIKEVFGKDSGVALKVFGGESGLKPDSKGWNCRYNGKSQACKVADRHLAWSVDCGVAQINVKGQECPAELIEPRHNIEHAKGMFDRRGWCPWVVAKKMGYCSNK